MNDFHSGILTNQTEYIPPQIIEFEITPEKGFADSSAGWEDGGTW